MEYTETDGFFTASCDLFMGHTLGIFYTFIGKGTEDGMRQYVQLSILCFGVLLYDFSINWR